ncbi:hypothetical protein [Erysipelatoclostridium sp. An173]|uniref:Uncharacterized protein n=1 Tax=Candidatus Erysipelatoclostridium merdavium TaxID=2838566 RepID=A0A9D2BLX4_9FIRM|nr:hypothetical protein [Erysipelatoclostridium sp. An173]OUP78637.1 hypothetical protein B5F09_02400 [Erysipelatoclostridium sp. An173]HIX80893.1 hypothetical protein [Candidatus Erysipelatoclostridium merdavium]
MALFDNLSKKAVKLTEKTIEKSSELADTAKTKVSIKSAEADMDEQFIKLGKIYYNIMLKDNVIDEETAEIIKEIERLQEKIDNLKQNLKNDE